MDIFDFADCNIFAQPLRDAAAKRGITERGDLARWLAQINVESAGFKRTVENLNYRSDTLLRVCNGRNGINTIDDATAAVMQGARGVANALYGGDWGVKHLGNTRPEDAFNFIGHGLIMVTGRWNHASVSAGMFGDDRLVVSPSLLTVGNIAADAAAWFWMSKHLNGVEDVTEITHKINGGENGLRDRINLSVTLLGYTGE